MLQLERVAGLVAWLGMQQPQTLQHTENPSSLMVRKVAIWVEASWGDSRVSQLMSSTTGPLSA